MAKQLETEFIGTVCGLTLYRMAGKYYARQKSSLSRKRVLKDPAYKPTMKNAGVLGKASPIGAKLYRLIDKEIRKRSMYQKLTGKVMRMLKEGMREKEIFSSLKDQIINKKISFIQSTS